ncbi:MAG: carbon-nitrogen hydrolase family protein [Vulcanimicrobiaceae bacterium]
MAERRIPVACIQARAHDRVDFETYWPHVLALADAAAAQGAKLVVLPEGTVPAYVLGTAPVEAAQLERAHRALAQIAERHAITLVYGGAKLVGGRTYNAAIVLGPDGRELGFAAKQFLWHFDRRWFDAGTTLDPIDTPAGRLGLLVCADGRVPTIAATLVERGAELLVMPTAWVTSGRDPSALENVQADLFVNVRAHENGVPFVAANKCGVELESVAYCGKSSILDANGRLVARAPEREETILRGEVTLGEPAERARHELAAPRDALTAREPRARARIAFTLASEPDELARFARLAASADADLLLACGRAQRGAELEILALDESAEDQAESTEIAGLRIGIVGSQTLCNPRGLVAARLAGLDLFVWNASGEPAWQSAYARTRASELRAFVVVLDRARARAFAVDPDGVVVSGTFESYRMAAFAYDRARSSATTVAPHTDVVAGLNVVETIRLAQKPPASSRR